MPAERFLIAVVLSLSACASKISSPPSLEEYLPEIEVDSFQFFHGSWIWPDSIYAFQISKTDLYIAKHRGLYQRHFSVSECPNIAKGYSVLLNSFRTTLDIALEKIEFQESDELIVDGPSYRLVYWPNDLYSRIEIRGGENARKVTPWLDATDKVRKIGDSCDSA